MEPFKKTLEDDEEVLQPIDRKKVVHAIATDIKGHEQ